MENSCKFGSRLCTLWFLLSIFLLLFFAKAENLAAPTGNVNLPPFLQWRHAYLCLRRLKNHTTCPSQYILNLRGWLNVTKSDGPEFCQPGGCGDQIKQTLKCIRYMKRDFWFANKAKVHHLNDTIYLGCTYGNFSGTSFYPTS